MLNLVFGRGSLPETSTVQRTEPTKVLTTTSIDRNSTLVTSSSLPQPGPEVVSETTSSVQPTASQYHHGQRLVLKATYILLALIMLCLIGESEKCNVASNLQRLRVRFVPAAVPEQFQGTQWHAFNQPLRTTHN